MNFRCAPECLDVSCVHICKCPACIMSYYFLESTIYYLFDFNDLTFQVQFGEGGKKLLSLAEALIKKHQNISGLHEPEGIVMLGHHSYMYTVLILLFFLHCSLLLEDLIYCPSLRA